MRVTDSQEVAWMYSCIGIYANLCTHKAIVGCVRDLQEGVLKY